MTAYRMLEYIREAPQATARTIDRVAARLPDLAKFMAKRHPRRLVVAGFGSSYTAAQMAAPMLHRHVAIPTTVTVATELVFDPSIVLDRDTMVILVSRSGERGWLADALAAVRQSGAACVAVTATEHSLLAQGSDLVVLTNEGPEAAYPKTKSVLAAAAALMGIALGFDADHGEAWQTAQRALSEAPQLLEASVTQAEYVLGSLGGWLAEHRVALITGTGGNVGTAHEGAVKVQEAAGLIGQWDNSGDALHGALGVLDPSWLFVGLVTPADVRLHEALLRLVAQFGAHPVCVVEGGLNIDSHGAVVVPVPRAGDALIAPLLYLPPLHLLTYATAVARGLDPDQPVFAETMLRAMLPIGRREPDWPPASTA